MYQHILATAALLFYKYGIRAVGVDRIIAEAEIAKATLYRHFRSKEDLIIAYLKARHVKALAHLQACVEAAGDDPVTRACAPFEQLAVKISADFRGCAFLIAVAEHEDIPEVRQAVLAYKDEVRELFATALCQQDPAAHAALARQLTLLYDGALATVMVRRNADDVWAARDCARDLAALHFPAHRG